MKIGHLLEVLIALALLYFLFSSLVSAIFEWYAYKTQQRGRFLYKSMLELLNDPRNEGYGATLYTHYSIDKLKRTRRSYPHYISSKLFADALIDLIGAQSESVVFEHRFDANHNIENVTLVEIRSAEPYTRFAAGVEKMNYSPLKNHLRMLYEKSPDYETLRSRIADWYDDYMERVSGWYKTRTRTALFIISLCVSLALNIDSIALIKKINTDDALRKNLVAQAEQRAFERKTAIVDSVPTDSIRRNANSPYAKLRRDLILDELTSTTSPTVKSRIEATVAKVRRDSLEALFLSNPRIIALVKDSIERKHLRKTDSLLTEISNTGIPIGYHGSAEIKRIHGDHAWLMWAIGILMSAIMLSFGAPFWFELMVKFINIRRSGVKPS